MESFYCSPSAQCSMSIAHRSVTSVKAVNRWQTFKEAAFRVPHWSAAAVREEKNRIVDVTKNAKIHLRQMLESHKEQMRLYKYISIFLPTALLRSITSCEQRSQVLLGNKAKT